MKTGGSTNWKQMEWIGFYFEFLCEKLFQEEGIDLNKIKYGRVSFDAFLEVPIDLKSHSINNPARSNKVITNGWNEIEMGIKDYGSIIFVIVCGLSKYNDEDMTLKKWHDKLKGKKSDYVIKSEKRNTFSRKRKTDFNLQKLLIIEVDDLFLKNQKKTQGGFRNSNGKGRNPKLELNLSNLHGINCVEYLFNEKTETRKFIPITDVFDKELSEKGIPVLAEVNAGER